MGNSLENGQFESVGVAFESVGVALATIGRNSLVAVVDSIFEQTYPVEQVVICVDGREFQDKVKVLLEANTNISRINILINESNLGASTTFNNAIGALLTKYVCLASDDDPWEPTKIENQISALLNFGKPAIVLTSVEYNSEHGKKVIRPRRLLSSSVDPMLQIFRTKPGIRSAPLYAPMGSAMFPNPQGKQIFDPKLRAYEDIWWLHKSYEEGLPTLQVKDIGIKGFVSHTRSSQRLDPDVYDFASRIEQIEAGLGSRFLIYHLTRAAIVSGDLKRLFHIYVYSQKTYGLKAIDIVSNFWQWPIVILMAFRKRFWRN